MTNLRCSQKACRELAEPGMLLTLCKNHREILGRKWAREAAENGR